MAKPKKAKRPRDWVPFNVSLSPDVAARLREFCRARGYLMRPVVEFAFARLLDNPPREIPQVERRGRPRKEADK